MQNVANIHNFKQAIQRNGSKKIGKAFSHPFLLYFSVLVLAMRLSCAM